MQWGHIYARERNDAYTSLAFKQHYFLFLLQWVANNNNKLHMLLGKTSPIRDALSNLNVLRH